MTRHGAEDLVRRVRGVGTGTLATILGRGFDVAATYAFYAVIARAIPVDELGRLVLGFALLQAAASVARLGLDQALLATSANGAMNRFSAAVVLAISIGIAAATAIVCRMAGHPLPEFGLWLAAALPCVAVGQFIIGALRARGDVVVAAIAETVAQPAVAAAGAFVASAYAASAASFAIAFAASWAAVLLFALRVDWRGDRLDRESAASFLRIGRSMLGVVVLNQSTASADLLLLGAIAGSAEVGRYAVAQKIAAAFLLLHGAITTASTPYMRALTDDRPLFARYYHAMTRWTLAMSLPLLVVCVAAPRLPLALFGRDYADGSAVPLVVLSLAAAVLLGSGPAGSTLLCSGHARELLRVTAGGAAALIIAVALLAPFGAAGAAAGVLIGRLVGRGLLVMAMRAYASIDFVDGPLLLIAAGAFGGAAATHLALPWLGAWTAAAAGTAIAVAIALVVLARSGDMAVLRAEFRRT